MHIGTLFFLSVNTYTFYITLQRKHTQYTPLKILTIIEHTLTHIARYTHRIEKMERGKKYQREENQIRRRRNERGQIKWYRMIVSARFWHITSSKPTARPLKKPFSTLISPLMTKNSQFHPQNS